MGVGEAVLINEFADREILGTMASVGALTVTEGDKVAYLVCDEKYKPTPLTPVQARKMARHLNRIARRIEDRNK